MFKTQKPIPPKLAERLLLWFLKSDLAEEVLGDLDERFLAKHNRKGLRKARWDYWLQVINYLRPFALKRLFKTQSNFTIMFKHNRLCCNGLRTSTLY